MLSTTLLLSAGLAASCPAPQGPLFEDPVRMTAGDGEVVRVEAPGYAAPCWGDVDGDGHSDLLVGQFNDGKISVYRGREDGTLAAHEWLEASGDVAQVPGVW